MDNNTETGHFWLSKRKAAVNYTKHKATLCSMDARCQVSDEQCINKCTRKQRHLASAKHSTMTRASTRRFSCAHPGTAALANELRGSKIKVFAVYIV